MMICYMRPITVITDHHSLCSLLRTKNSKNLRIARWALEVQEANITVKYRKGSLHGNADCLSRLVPLAKPCRGFDSSFNVMAVQKNKTYAYNFKDELIKSYNKDNYFSHLLQELKS